MNIKRSIKSNSNGRSNVKCKIKTGDKVIVIAGDSKGQKTTVLEVWPQEQKVILKDVNLRNKKTRDSNGAVTRKPHCYPIHISNVAILDPRFDTATKVGLQISDISNDGEQNSANGDKRSKKKIRIAKRSSEQI